MSVPKLPAAALMFRNPRKEPGFIHANAVSAHLNLVIRSGHHRQIRRERIYSQVLTPLQFDLLDATGDRRRDSAIREHQMTLGRHKNEGLSAKCLRHADGPSWVMSCATVRVKARTPSSTAEAWPMSESDVNRNRRMRALQGEVRYCWSVAAATESGSSLENFK